LITLQDMVNNRSISPAGAAVLRSIGAGGHSFLVYALPRNAGKSTVAQAILGEAPAELAREEFFGTQEEVRALSAVPPRGYVVVAEIGHRGRPGYLSGDEVPRIFQLVSHGYSLASSLHADSVAEVFEVLQRNGVAADAAATVPYLIKVRVLGEPDSPSTPRVVEQIHQVTADSTATLLYQWDGQPATT
jgi:hypothetical protein